MHLGHLEELLPRLRQGGFKAVNRLRIWRDDGFPGSGTIFLGRDDLLLQLLEQVDMAFQMPQAVVVLLDMIAKRALPGLVYALGLACDFLGRLFDCLWH